MPKLKGRPKKGSTDTRLSDLGVSEDQSSRWQQLADVLEEEFEVATTRRQDLGRCKGYPDSCASEDGPVEDREGPFVVHDLPQVAETPRSCARGSTEKA
jgi:hypothetical protein